MGKQSKKLGKNGSKSVFARSRDTARELLQTAASCVGMQRPKGLSADDAEDFLETVTDLANDLACFGNPGSVSKDERRDFLHAGESALYALKIYTGQEALDQDKCTYMAARMYSDAWNGRKEPWSLSDFIDEISEFYYGLFDDADEIIGVSENIATRLVVEAEHRFPDMEARKKRAEFFRSFPIFRIDQWLQKTADMLENPKCSIPALAEQYGDSVASLARLIASGDLSYSDVRCDTEISGVADGIEDKIEPLPIIETMNEVFLNKETINVPVNARKVGVSLLDRIRKLACVAPTGNFEYDSLRGAAADVSYKIARELAQYDGPLNERVNFEFLGSLAGNMEIVIDALLGDFDMNKEKKNLQKTYRNFADSFSEEVEGAREICNAFLKTEPKDAFDILKRIVALTNVKMRAYNHEFEASTVDEWCTNCYAHELANDLDEVFDEKYANKLNLYANGMERLAKELRLPNGRTDVFVYCATAFRQYLTEPEPETIYGEVLTRFACALVELAGLIHCDVISARDAAQMSWLDEEFLTELSQHPRVEEYCVAMKRSTT